MNTVDVFPGSRQLVKGAVPSSSMLLIGPPGVGKTIFCKQFLYQGLLVGEPCLYVSTDESPQEIVESMGSFGFNLTPYLDTRMFRVVDCYSWKLGGGSSSEFAVDSQHDYLTAVSINCEKASQDLQRFRFVLDSITEFTSLCDQEALCNFLQVMVARIRSAAGKAIFTVASGAHDERFLNFLRLTFDGTLEMRIDDSGAEFQRLLRIFSLKRVQHKTAWTPFKITGQGILVTRETAQRCDMCSKIIDWEPLIVTINGQDYCFDSAECADTYKKLRTHFGYR